MIGGLDQGGLGLPDRDYYLKDDDASKALRADYQAHVAKVLELLGRAPAVAATEAADIVALETELAKVSKDKVARRDPQTMYNRLDKAGVQKAAPSIDWAAFWNKTGITTDAVTVGAPAFPDVGMFPMPFPPPPPSPAGACGATPSTNWQSVPPTPYSLLKLSAVFVTLSDTQ